MEFQQFIFWFFIIVSMIYGLLIGSFLNVVIYRLPPRVFVFDDLFFDVVSTNIITDFREWLASLKRKKRLIPEQLEPILYAEPMLFVPFFPEMSTVAGIASSFNLYQEYMAKPMSIDHPKRSFCPNCGKKINWWMNIPILSYIILRGKCYHCKCRISWRYPLIELLSGLLCGALFYAFGMQHVFVFLYYYILAALCIVVFFIDLDHWLILDEITLPFSLVGILGSLFIPLSFYNPIGAVMGGSLIPPVTMPGFIRWLLNPGVIGSGWLQIHLDSFFQAIIGAIVCFAILYAIGVIGTALAKREAMGGGDLKFAMLMGAFLGLQKAGLAFFLAVILGTVFMVPGVIVGRKTGKDQVPFGCFLTVGTVLTIFFGDRFFSWYLQLPYRDF